MEVAAGLMASKFSTMPDKLYDISFSSSLFSSTSQSDMPKILLSSGKSCKKKINLAKIHDVIVRTPDLATTNINSLKKKKLSFD